MYTWKGATAGIGEEGGKKKRHTNLVEHKFGQSCGILRRGSNAQLLALFSSDLLDRVPDSWFQSLSTSPRTRVYAFSVSPRQPKDKKKKRHYQKVALTSSKSLSSSVNCFVSLMVLLFFCFLLLWILRKNGEWKKKNLRVFIFIFNF